MSIDWQRLAAPFPASDIEWKPGATTRDKSKGLAMAYITARAVQERLDEVFGPGRWKNEFRPGPEGGVLCRIYFKNEEGEWVWREDGADNTDVEAIKGGLSNAMKRAGAALGIGRYLYKMPAQWVPLDDRGRFSETPRIPQAFLPRRRAEGRSTTTPTEDGGEGPPAEEKTTHAPRLSSSGDGTSTPVPRPPDGYAPRSGRKRIVRRGR